MGQPEVLPPDAVQLPAVAAFDPDAVVLDLQGATNRLPEAAIRAVRQHRDVMVPRLIEVLRQATAQVRAGQKVAGNAHFFALLLLAELHAKEALPAVLEAVSLPGEGPFDLFEDAITALLAPILLKLSDDPQDLLDRMIADPALNYFVRWEAAEAHVYLVRDGRLTRLQAVERLRDHLLREMARPGDPGEIITGLVSVLSGLAPKEAYEQIKEAYAQGMVDESMILLEDIDRSLAEGEARMQRTLRQLQDFDDTLEELRHWASFAPKAPSPRAWPTQQTPQILNQAPLLAPAAFPAPADPIRADKKVGRNDPCPCGSGKKYKKCCGR